MYVVKDMPNSVEGGLVDLIASEYDLLVKQKEPNILDQTTEVDELITNTIEHIQVNLELTVNSVTTTHDYILFGVVDPIVNVEE